MTLTFSLYELQEGGTPLWTETQTAQLHAQGHYTVLLGASSPEGLPLDLFTSGAARWVGVQPQLPGQGEQPRVLLVGVPYALKAADADTLGGKPASAFVTTESGIGPSAPGGHVLNEALSAGAALSQAHAQASPLTVGGGGTTNYIPIWTNSTTLGNSTIFETGGMVGIGDTSPDAALDVVGPNASGTDKNAPTVLQVTGGTGGQGGGIPNFVPAGAGGPIQLTSGTGGAGGMCSSGCPAPGGPGGSIQITGGTGGNATETGSRGGPGGSITLQPGAGGKQVGFPFKGPPGNVILVPTAGKVGIGTTAPANTLEVVAGGTTLADHWTIRSSLRWKTNVRTLDGALETVERLRGVSYDSKANGKHEIGVIAEEVGQVVPEVVSYEAKQRRGARRGLQSADGTADRSGQATRGQDPATERGD